MVKFLKTFETLKPPNWKNFWRHSHDEGRLLKISSTILGELKDFLTVFLDKPVDEYLKDVMKESLENLLAQSIENFHEKLI